MKENIDIEKLFKDKFENFQPDVNPGAWANIQAGIAASTTAAATGVSAAVKIALISTGIAAASVATWYFGFYEPEQPANTPIIAEQNDKQLAQEDVTTGQTIIHVNDQNDPVIIENREEIERAILNNNPNGQAVNGTETDDSNASGTNTASGSITPENPGNTGQNDVPVVKIEQDGNSGTGDSGTDKVKPAPTGRMEYTQAAIYAPSQVVFAANAKNHTEVKWDFGDGSSAEGADVKHIYSRPGKYTVTMRVAGEDHTYSESQELVVKSKSSIDNIPNVITPNSDRINDIFSINTTDIETFTISIRDRSGNEVFNSTDKDFTWDGTDFSGNTVEKGMYTYIIIATGADGGVFKIPGQIYVQ
jgi:gliding motility-associated-like protein